MFQVMVSLLLVPSVLFAPAGPTHDDGTFVTVESAGPDYQIQGEYVGEIGEDGQSRRFALQVIALGEGKFDLVAYRGGLPGDGWDGEERIRATGATKDGETRLVAEGHGYAIAGESKFTIYSPDGEQVGVVEKVERKSPTLGAKPPKDAIVLFDGTTADAFERGQIVMDKLLAADCETKQKFGDHTLHLEFRTPFKPAARGQARGNSGVYLQGRYELQVLDSFGLEGENNECGGIYSISKPAVNSCFPPLTWQTYDIDFTAAKYENGEKTKNARATIRHNGIVIHDDLELVHGTPGKHAEADGPDVLYLQGHGNPVVYRNIWIVE
jgi:3-keto-disaccharide hydrolase